MPEPQTVNYRVYYLVTEDFINDFITCTSQMAYVDVMKIMNIVKRHDNIVAISHLNELVRTLGTFPYKYVHQLMSNVNNEEYFSKYFVRQPEGFDPGF